MTAIDHSDPYREACHLREENAHLRLRNSQLEKVLGVRNSSRAFPVWSRQQFQFKADRITEWIQRQRALGRIPGEEEFELRFLEEYGMTYYYWIAERDWHLAFFQREVETAP